MSNLEKTPEKAPARSENFEYDGCYADYARLFRPGKLKHADRTVNEVDEHGPVSRVIEPIRFPGQPVLPRPKKRVYRNYLDGPYRLMPSVDDGKYPGKKIYELPLRKALDRCYRKAKAHHKRYFGLTRGGICVAAKDDGFKHVTVPRHGLQIQGRRKDMRLADDQCRAWHKGQKLAGRGSVETNAVYRIKEMGITHRRTRRATRSTREGKDPNRYKYDTPNPGTKMECDRDDYGLFQPSRTQLFSQEFFTQPGAPKGMLLFKSAGSGKTCGAVGIMSHFMEQTAGLKEKGEVPWNIIWVTRKGIRDAPLNALFNDMCNDHLRALLLSDKPITLKSGAAVTFPDGRKFESTDPKTKVEFLRKYREKAQVILKSYNVTLEMQRIITYNQLVKMITGRDKSNVSGQQFSRPNRDFGYRTLFIFDEAHNIESKALNSEERVELDRKFKNVKFAGKSYSGEGRELIRHMLHRSHEVSGADSARILLMTATPMSKTPVELFSLLNLIAEPGQPLLSLNLRDYIDPVTMELKRDGIDKFKLACDKRISYYSAGSDPTIFALKVLGSVNYVDMQPFHEQILKDRLKSAKTTTDRISVYRNVGMVAQTRGRFLRPASIDAYERKRSSEPDPEQEKHSLTVFYRKHIAEATKAYMTSGSSNKVRATSKTKKGAKRKTKRRTKAQVQFKDFVTKDPSSGQWRMKSEEEFSVPGPRALVAVKNNTVSLSYIMWHKKLFKPEIVTKTRKLYAPTVDRLIRKIFELEEKEGPSKHTVFTSSLAGKGPRASNYGSAVVASIFEADPRFHVMTVYIRNGGRGVHLKNTVPPGKIGVCVLASSSIPNIRHAQNKGSNQKVEYNVSIQKATKKAFNSSDNVDGSRIKIMILDDNYREGVDAYDVAHAHFLQPGLSKSELEQAAARSSRFCGSKHLKFYKHMGSFVKMHFYMLRMADQRTVYDAMMGDIPEMERKQTAMLDIFNHLAAQYSIDYWLNVEVNEYAPMVTVRMEKPGPVTDTVSVQAQLSGKFETLTFHIPHDPSNMTRQRRNEDGKMVDVYPIVQDSNGRTGIVRGYNPETRLYKFLTNGFVQNLPGEALFMKPGSTFRTKLPVGVEPVIRLLNVGDIRNVQARTNLDDFGIKNAPKKPEHELPMLRRSVEAVNSLYNQPDVQSVVFGTLSIIDETQKQHVRMRLGLNLFDIRKRQLSVPTPKEVAVIWSYDDKTGHLARGQDMMQALEKNVKLGYYDMTLTWLFFVDRASGFVTHSNLLIFSPKFRILERFEPSGAGKKRYHSQAIDVVLQGMMPDGWTYMKSDVSIKSLLRHQTREDQALNHTIFGLLYLHMRIMYYKEMTDREEALKYPTAFKTKLVNYVRQNKVDLRNFLADYAKNLSYTPDRIQAWRGYDDDFSFLWNAIQYMREKLGHLRSDSGTTVEKPKSQQSMFERFRTWMGGAQVVPAAKRTVRTSPITRRIDRTSRTTKKPVSKPRPKSFDMLAGKRDMSLSRLLRREASRGETKSRNDQRSRVTKMLDDMFM